MKCVCKRKCQPRCDDGIIRRFNPGEVFDFKKCPTHFDTFAAEVKEGVDFLNASEDVLGEADFELKDLKVFLKEKFDIKAGNAGKVKLIEKLLYARQNHKPQKYLKNLM